MASCSKIERYILKYVNKSRRKRGRNSLENNRGLKSVARNHSRHMAKKGKIWHGKGVHIAKENISHRKGFWGFIESLFSSYSYSSGGENVAMTSSGKSSENIARSFHKMWMKSLGHKRNILDPKFSLIGIGVKKSRKGYFATELFYG